MMMIHRPVLLTEVVSFLSVKQNGIYVDGTIGSGGHSEEILKRLGSDGRIIGIDKDEDALKAVGKRINDTRLILIHGDFSDIETIVDDNGYTKVEGILLDLGVSMMQLKNTEKGFSIHSDSPLDMRMDRSTTLTAWEIVNNFSERKIGEIIWMYGEERQYRKISKAIVDERRKGKVNTCRELADVIYRIYGRRSRIHPATKTFQALRIYVNKELESLSKALNNSLGILSHGGRLCVISYHSLEDRIVKQFMKEQDKNSCLRVLTKKPVSPSINEINSNPSSRSAKLRVGEYL